MPRYEKLHLDFTYLEIKENHKITLPCIKYKHVFFFQVASFPFQKSMSLMVVMPMSGQVNMSTLTAKLNISDLYNRLPKQRAVQVKVPKFNLEYGQELKDVFTKIGKIKEYVLKFVFNHLYIRTGLTLPSLLC